MRPVLLFLLLLALMLVAGSVAWTGRAADELSSTIQTIQEELPEVPSRTTTFVVYHSSTGLALSDAVTTTRGELDDENTETPETDAQWQARHRATVEAAVADYTSNGYQITPPTS